MVDGEFLTRWTVRLAVVLYVASLASRGFSPRGSRLTWTGGCILYLAHVVCAFAYYHDWSHTAAYDATARQTAETVGVDWGGGLYANYTFTLVWTLDMLWWWVNAASYRSRRRGVDWAVHGFLGFIVFNATIVFATGFSRWLGVAGCVLLLIIVAARLRSSRYLPPREEPPC